MLLLFFFTVGLLAFIPRYIICISYEKDNLSLLSYLHLVSFLSPGKKVNVELFSQLEGFRWLKSENAGLRFQRREFQLKIHFLKDYKPNYFFLYIFSELSLIIQTDAQKIPKKYFGQFFLKKWELVGDFETLQCGYAFFDYNNRFIHRSVVLITIYSIT